MITFRSIVYAHINLVSTQLTKVSMNTRRVAFLDLQWPYKRHAGVFAGANRYAQEQGWETTIDDYVDEELQNCRPGQIPYDGVIGRASKKLAEQAGRLTLPVVNTWVSSPVKEQLPCVLSDLEASARMMAEHLLARGLRRFSCIGTNDHASKLKMAAFQTAVGEAGFSCMITRVPLNFTRTYTSWKRYEQRIADAMDRWQPPIGVYARAEQTARLVAQMCRRRGWRVPHDVAIIGGQNEESLCEHPRPSLSSVECGYERIGYEAARLLDRLMDQRDQGAYPAATPEHILLPPIGLLVRESTDFYAIDDPLIAKALAFIADNSHRPINAADVARAVGVGMRTLQLHFDKTLSRPVSTEIQRVRLERAKRELTQSDRPIQDIARDTGFGRAMRMYNAFRRELGTTPRNYRKQRRVQQNQ